MSVSQEYAGQKLGGEGQVILNFLLHLGDFCGTKKGGGFHGMLRGQGTMMLQL